jgi:tRNA pseudouridine55 synthase
MSYPVVPDGVLLVDKAEGMTSHDVVALVRRKLQVRKVGHCGTLDPIATGLLLITVGRGTKVQDLLMSEDKEYAGTFVLGVTTDTQDRQGEIIQQRPVPALDENQIRAAFDFSVLCSKGFYVRTYVHEIGETLGCGAHLKSLRRTKSGRFDVANAISVAQIKDAPPEEILSRLLSLPDVSRMRGA